MRVTPKPRLVDWTLLAALAGALGSGLLSLISGEPSRDWVFILHGITGIIVVVLLAWKLRRVYPRLRRPTAWQSSTPVSVLTLTAAAGVLGTGVVWVMGGDITIGVAGMWWNAMNLHIFFGLVLTPLLLVHLYQRAHPPSRTDLEGRRTVVQYGILILGGIIAWKLQAALTAALESTQPRRFTGSREAGTAPGNTFPATSWVADAPPQIDTDSWRLHVGGAVTTPREFTYPDLTRPNDQRVATLDCTSGWYTEQSWTGIRVDRLFAAVEPTDDARWVSFKSVTGYRWSLPITEAREALLATHVGGEPLTHGHGFPARLVAPGRRGFQWVKWIDSIEVRRSPDYGQFLAIFTSGFT